MSYLLLRAMFPPERDEIHEDVHFVSAEEDAWHLRDDFLNALAERATAEALAGLLSLSSTHPNDLRVTSALLQGRRSIFGERVGLPPEPEWLAGLFADTGRRLVRSESELAALLTQVLADVEHDARSHGELLWDRIRKRDDDDAEDLWLPKTEAAFAADARTNCFCASTDEVLPSTGKSSYVPRTHTARETARTSWSKRRCATIQSSVSYPLD